MRTPLRHRLLQPFIAHGSRRRQMTTTCAGGPHLVTWDVTSILLIDRLGAPLHGATHLDNDALRETESGATEALLKALHSLTSWGFLLSHAILHFFPERKIAWIQIWGIRWERKRVNLQLRLRVDANIELVPNGIVVLQDDIPTLLTSVALQGWRDDVLVHIDCLRARPLARHIVPYPHLTTNDASAEVQVGAHVLPVLALVGLRELLLQPHRWVYASGRAPAACVHTGAHGGCVE